MEIEIIEKKEDEYPTTAAKCAEVNQSCIDREGAVWIFPEGENHAIRMMGHIASVWETRCYSFTNISARPVTIKKLTVEIEPGGEA